MKYRHVCPKCGSSEILRVPATAGAYGSGNVVRVGLTNLSSVPVTRYACTGCGFVEEWVDAEEDMAKLQRRYGQKPTPT